MYLLCLEKATPSVLDKLTPLQLQRGLDSFGATDNDLNPTITFFDYFSEGNPLAYRNLIVIFFVHMTNGVDSKVKESSTFAAV